MARDPGQVIGHLPLAFEPNLGQARENAKFLAHGSGYGLYLNTRAALLTLAGRGSQSSVPSPGAVALEMRLEGASANAELSAIHRLPGHSNYFIGKDPAGWRTNIPQFSRVRYGHIYPGINLDFYGNEGRLEYDFEVSPAGDARRIELGFGGMESVRLATNGDLVLIVKGREVRFEAPRAYQGSGTQTTAVSASFVLRGGNRVGFDLGRYDRSRTLVIDPVLTFSSYLGGSGAESCSAILGIGFVAGCPGIAVDSASRVYVAGTSTSSAGFPVPTTGAAAGLGPGGAADVFLARISSTGTALTLDYLTFIGGSGIDYPTGVAVDSGFNVYLTGTTGSPDFPTTSSAFQTTAPAGNHVFMSKLDPSGSANLYSSYLAGSGTDTASGLAVDAHGIAYIFGTTTSPNFPTTSGALQPAAAAASQFFFSKLNPSTSGTSGLEYSTFFGGSSPANGLAIGGGIAVDANLNVYVAGGTSFTNMPVVNAFQGTEQGGFDVWAAKLTAPNVNTQQYTAAYETYFGGSGDDIAYGVATDGTSTYVTGSTTSTSIAVPAGTTAFQAANGGAMDGFIAKFGVPVTTGTTQGSVPLSYFTYLGGSANDAGLAIVSDPGSTGNVRVTGFTDSANFPVANSPIQTSSGGGRDAFIARIQTTGTASLNAVSYLGGAGTDIGTAVAVDQALNTYLSGETSSSNFPLLIPLQTSLSGPSDAFLSKLGPNVSGLSFVCTGTGCPSPAPPNPSVSPTPVGVGNQITFTYSIFNTGDPVTGVLFTDSIGQPANSTIASASASPGTCSLASGGITAFCNLGAVPTSPLTTSGTTSAPGAAATVTIMVSATPPSSTGVIPPKPPDIGNSAVLTVAGATLQRTASGTASVNDFGITATPSTATVIAGATASYVITATPTGPIPESVSLACGSGLPAQATCSFSGTSSIANLNNGAQSLTLDISTTQRVTTPAALSPAKPYLYVLWLPITGLAVFASGIGRRPRLVIVLFAAFLISLAALASGCGSSRSSTSTTTGTPAGTYFVTVNATSGNATRSTTVQLVVQ
ncbi:MAG: hypothetical protein JOZ14_16915 [Acidobacteria bacterium]|nr:hypothetical protein [Acidobacteriota bacterium]